MNDAVDEFNGAARRLPRGDESPRYYVPSLQDWNCRNMSCKDIVK
jgi:hypothetical protein